MFLSVGRFQQAFERRALRCRQFVRAPAEEPFFAQRFRRTLRFHDEKFIAGLRKSAESKHLHRRRWTGFLDGLAMIVDQRLYFAGIIAADKWIADSKRAH